MENPDDHVGVVGVHIVESTSIWKAVMVEERGLGIDSISANTSLKVLLVERLHQAEGVESVLGQEGSRQVNARVRRKGEEGVEEMGSGEVITGWDTLERQ